MKKLRIFYKDNILWTHGLEGDGDYPQDVENDLKEQVEGSRCIILEDEKTISDFMSSDTNTIQDDKLTIGEPRINPTLLLVKSLQEQIDELKIEIENLK